MALQDDELTDDYVASLLKRDAERLSKPGVSLLGGSSGPRPKTLAKPNTRFFRNIIRETDNHNAALKAREEADARARARRSNGDAIAEEGRERGDKRRRTEGRDRHDDERRRDGRDRDRHRGGRDDGKRRESHRPSLKDERKPRTSREGEGHGMSSRRARSRSREFSRTIEKARGDRERPAKRSKRSSEHRSRSPRPRPSPSRHAARSETEDASDTSSLGPEPPARGRGAKTSHMGTIDSRFAPDYDPRRDFSIDDERHEAGKGDDWSSSLAAVRARAEWRGSGGKADARAKGTADERVDVSDVRWQKKGEQREWDRGKTVDGDSVDVRPAWA